MTLPPALRRWWPYFKRAHRTVTRLGGHVYRLLAVVLGERGVPRRATERAADTASAEPGSVRLHPGQPEVELTRPATPGEPSGHWAFEAARAVTVPATFTLEITDGRLSGDVGAAITPGGMLDHETSTYFGVDDWREHPVYLRPTLGTIEPVEGTVLSLTTRGTASNYYHFLYDAVGRLAVLEASRPGVRYDAVVVPHRAGYQRQLLDLVGIDAPLVQPRAGVTLRADRLLVPSNPNWALDAPPATVEWLRRRLPPTDGHREPTRIYVTRGDQPHTRRYVEERELWPHLERRGFIRLDPGQLTVQEQIDTFHAAEVVVSPHGAGLTNITFGQPGVRVLEMFASSYVHLGLWAICQAIGADYRYLVADGPPAPGDSNAGILDDVSIPARRVLAVLDRWGL